MSHLNIAEAVPLGYAMVARVAHDAGVRALAIKGPMTDHYGLRPSGAKQSCDVDILVEPSGVDVLLGRLRDIGWRGGEMPRTAQFLPIHSVNLNHPNWPCEIDLHLRWPGFLADAESSFEVLQESTEVVTIAQMPVMGVDRPGSIIISALHLLRDGDAKRSEMRALAQTLASLPLEPLEIERMASIAQRAGASQTLLPLWDWLNIAKPEALGNEVIPIKAWRARQEYGRLPVMAVIYELRHTKGIIPRVRRAIIIFRLSGGELRRSRGAEDRNIAVLQFQRGVRALRAMMSHRAQVRSLFCDSPEHSESS